MQRRNFIKTAMCVGTIGCLGAMTPVCKDIYEDYKLKNDKFYYKSKDELPKRIRLEACSLCQLKCPACTIRMMEKDMPKDWLGYLKFKDFKKLVDENNIERIELSNNGEIFLNPELNKIIKYAHEKNITLTALGGTNLNTISDETIEALVKYKFQALTVSIDGATPETYKIYRRGGDFDTVINNIKKINLCKKKYNSEFPRLKWQFILFGHNEHEIELAKKKAKELNMGIKFKRNVILTYSPVKNPTLVEKQTGLKIYNKMNGLIKDSFKRQKIYTCYMLFLSPQIDYNGDILGCCRTFKFGGNAFRDGLLNALNSKNYIYAKHMVTDLSTPPLDEVPCSQCITYKYIKEEKSPLTPRDDIQFD